MMLTHLLERFYEPYTSFVICIETNTHKGSCQPYFHPLLLNQDSSIAEPPAFMQRKRKK